MNTSPGAILLLLLAIYLLLAFFTGRLEWLFGMARDVQAGYRAPGGAAGVPTPQQPLPPGQPAATRWPYPRPTYA